MTGRSILAAMWVRVVLLLLAAIAALGAASGWSMQRLRPPVIDVMVDASASTRGMWFRDAAAVRTTVGRLASQIAPGATLRFFTFTDGAALPMTDPIAERVTAETSLPTLDADAVLLLSDGNIDASAAPATLPIFPIVGAPELTGDARLIGVEEDGDGIVVTVVNDGPARTLTWPDGAMNSVPRGSIRLAHLASAEAGIVRLNPGDRWPENDVLAIGPAIAPASERWWIGTSKPEGFRSISVNALPTREAWLAARCVVLNNVPAESLSEDAQAKLSAYVHDLGGGLVIVGGDRAFSAGGYGGTALDALSPLASRPPEPRQDWLVLIDASGSMAAQADDGRTRLDAAVDAAATLVTALPQSESVSVASFARELRSWPVFKDRRLVAPSDLAANGPTNLDAAFEAIVRSRKAGPLPLRVVVLTDGDSDASRFASTAKHAGIIVDWVRLSADAAGDSLREVVRTTGGSVIDAGATGQWRAAAVKASHAAEHVGAASQPTPVVWTANSGESIDSASQANTTWLRSGAEALATRASSTEGGNTPIAARWRIGEGQVAAIGFAAPANAVDRVAQSVATAPQDARYRVRWRDAGEVTIDAADSGTAMNDLKIVVREVGGDSAVDLQQIAPGRYAGTIPPTPHSRLLATRVGGTTINLHALAGGPTAEFSAIGVDRHALENLASRTGGRLIDRDDVGGPPIVARRGSVALTVPLLIISMLALLGALYDGPLCRHSGRGLG